MKILRLARTLTTLLALSTLLLASVVNAADNAYSMSGTMRFATGNSETRVIPAIQATGALTSAGSKLTVLPGAFSATGSKLLSFPLFAAVAQVQSTFTTSHPSSHVFQSNGGPGAFTFCPPVANPINSTILGPCSAPNQGTAARNGRLVYKAGPKQFGGTMTLARKVILQNANNIGASLAQHTVQVSGWTIQSVLDANHRLSATIAPPVADTQPIIWVAGGASANTQTNPVEPFQITSPVYTPTNMTFIMTGGPIVPQSVAPVPNGTLISTGFPFTTGTVTVSNTQFGLAFFTSMGSDNRTPSGEGSIQLVAGGLAKSAGLGFAFQRLARLTMTLPEPSTGSALAAGIALLLVAARLRRR